MALVDELLPEELEAEFFICFNHRSGMWSCVAANKIRAFGSAAHVAVGNEQHVSQRHTIPVCLAELYAEPTNHFLS